MDPTPRKPSAAAISAGLAAVALALYARTLGHPYIHLDDNRYVFENSTVQAGLTWEGVRWAFTTFHASNWHPLSWLSHMLDASLFGPGAAGPHAVNALLHAACTVLLFRFLDRATGARGRSALVAALFAVHPLHVESVAWVAERKDVLSTAFGLLALLAYLRHAARPSMGRLAAVAALMAASLLAKPMWVTLPFLLLLLDLWPLRRTDTTPLRTLALEKLPLLALSVGSSVMTMRAQLAGGTVAEASFTLGARVATAVVGYGRYVLLHAWPSGLSIFHRHPVALPAWEVALGVAVLTGLAAVAWLARRTPAVAVGIAWFLGTLVPVIGLVQVGSQVIGERYTYLPGVGLFIAVVWGLHALVRTPRASQVLGVVGAVAVLAYAGVAWARVGDWRSNEALFRAALEVDPANAIALEALAEGYRAGGQREDAIVALRQAAALEPAEAKHWNNLGVNARELGRSDEAYAAFQQALAVEPGKRSAWRNLALAAEDLGRLDEADAALEQFARLAPQDPNAWRTLVAFRARHGNMEGAARAYEVLRQLPGGVTPAP
ncbi:MAG: tetratricopeptide repeat protein [Anaeromyxobacteraceae bacterium]